MNKDKKLHTCLLENLLKHCKKVNDFGIYNICTYMNCQPLSFNIIFHTLLSFQNCYLCSSWDHSSYYPKFWINNLSWKRTDAYQMLNTRKIVHEKVNEKVKTDSSTGNEDTFLPFKWFCIAWKHSKI